MLNLLEYFNPRGWFRHQKCPYCEFLEKYPDHYKRYPHLKEQDKEIGNICKCDKYDFWEKKAITIIGSWFKMSEKSEKSEKLAGIERSEYQGKG